MRKLIFILVLFFSTSVFGEEKCNLIEEIFTDKCKEEKLFGLPVVEEPKPNQRIFANCKIANVKENMTKNAVFGIVNACREKAKDPSIIDWIRYGW